MDFVRNALKSERDTSIAGRGNGFKARLSEIDNAMARDCYRYGNAKLLQSHGQRAQNIGQTARLGEGRTFCSNHQNAKHDNCLSRLQVPARAVLLGRPL